MFKLKIGQIFKTISTSIPRPNWPNPRSQVGLHNRPLLGYAGVMLVVRLRHGVDSATINLWDDVRKTMNIAIISQLN